jgi:hypothetical protein
MNRESSSDLVICTRRAASSVDGTEIIAGSRNDPGMSAGRAGSWQQDMEHDIIPPMALMSCPQSTGDECCSGAGCCLW